MSMDAVEFIKARDRMIKEAGSAPTVEYTHARPAEEIVAIVEKWAEEHPVKMRQTEFLKQWPNAPLDGGALVLCPRAVDFTYTCPINEKGCKVCRKQFWSQEVQNESNH